MKKKKKKEKEKEEGEQVAGEAKRRQENMKT